MSAHCENMEACSLASFAMARRAEWEELAANVNPGPLEAVDRDIAAQDVSDATIEAAELPFPPAAAVRCARCILNTTEFGFEEDFWQE